MAIVDTSATTAGFAISVSIIALQLIFSLDHSGTTAAFNSALQDLLPLAAMAGLVAAVAFIYGHMHRAGCAAGDRCISDVATPILYLSASHLLFCLPAANHDVQQARALGMVAVRALLVASTVAFFWGMTLIYAHISNGVGTGGAAVVVVGDDEQTPAPAVRLLAKITLASAAAVVSLMLMILAVYK